MLANERFGQKDRYIANVMRRLVHKWLSYCRIPFYRNVDIAEVDSPGLAESRP